MGTDPNQQASSINNSAQNQVFVPYFFDRQGYYVANEPTQAIPLTINPCTNTSYTSSHSLTKEQKMVCAALAKKQYVSPSSSVAALQTEFSADKLTGVTTAGPNPHLVGIQDPISIRDPKCIVTSQDETIISGSNPWGMHQRGANRWARGNLCWTPARGTAPWSVRLTNGEQILTHYYTDIQLRNVSTKTPILPNNRWVPLKINWGTADRQAPVLTAGGQFNLSLQIQNTGITSWPCSYQLIYRWVGPESYDGSQHSSVCGSGSTAVAAGGDRTVTLSLSDIPDIAGTYSLQFDIADGWPGTFRFSDSNHQWPSYKVNVSICPGGNCTRTPRKLDLAFVIDTTGSMVDDIAAVKTSATNIVNTIASQGDDYRVALVDFRDFPEAPYGGIGDYPAQLDLAFSSTQNDIVAAINGLSLGWGNDTPESVYSGLNKAIELGWRSDAQKIIILMGDAPAHDAEPHTGYTLASMIAAAQAGGHTIAYSGKLLAPARQSTSTTTPIAIYPLLIGNDSAAYTNFQQLAQGTAGTLFQAATANNVTATMLAAINTVLDAPKAQAGGPYSGNAGIPISFNGQASSDPNGVIAYYEWDFESDGVFDTISTEPQASYSYPSAFLGKATLRVTDDDGTSSTSSAFVSITGGSIPGFPNTGLLDTFNRADGAVGNAWVGNSAGYNIVSSTLHNIGGNPSILLWNTAFGPNQEAYFKLSSIDPQSDEIDLILKSQDATECNLIEVWYKPARGTAQVWTCHNYGTWIQHGGDIPMTLANGDQFGARAFSDGTVRVYKNGTQIGTVQVSSSWPYRQSSGRAGIWILNASNSSVDDFGAGSLP